METQLRRHILMVRCDVEQLGVVIQIEPDLLGFREYRLDVRLFLLD